MQDAYAAGEVHIGWGTLDMVPLFVERIVGPDGTPKDSRVMPRIYQQVDWSNGGDGIVVRETHQDRRRPARQEARAGPELAVALLRPEHAGRRRRAAVRSGDGLHAGRLRGGGRLQRPGGRRRRRLLGARHLQPERGQGQPPAGDHRHGQQADRRRLVRPGRLRQGPSGDRRGPGPRHLRRHGGAQGRCRPGNDWPS